ncbi:MAG TPA: glycosyltransferase family 2 protein [Microbacteriaceae bacterium]|jgi:glycosyltransferase involved in cell wall biosynthesis|nr:glycosyltransferase family 2 protein [Microbacteriaceae bacterium]
MEGRVALIIRCHNEEAHIGRLLTGALHQTRVPDEIILVDSGSTDATVSIASAFPTKIVSIPPEDFSFGRALNVGLAASTSDFAAFASAHVYPVYDSWIERLVAPFQDERIALTYGRQQAPPDGRFSEQQLLTRWFPSRSVARQRDPFCNNANAAIRRSVWETLPYDEQLTGLEDLDWAKRALDLGHELSYVAEAPVIHVHHESFPQVVNRYRREAIAHKQIYDEHGMRLTTAVRLGVANIVGDARDAQRRGVLGTQLPDIVRFRGAQFYGTYRGFRQRGPVTELLRQRFYYPPNSDHRVDGNEPSLGSAIDYDGPLPNR